MNKLSKALIFIFICIGLIFTTLYLAELNNSLWKGIIGSIIILVLGAMVVLTSAAKNRQSSNSFLKK